MPNLPDFNGNTVQQWDTPARVSEWGRENCGYRNYTTSEHRTLIARRAAAAINAIEMYDEHLTVESWVANLTSIPQVVTADMYRSAALDGSGIGNEIVAWKAANYFRRQKGIDPTYWVELVDSLRPNVHNANLLARRSWPGTPV